MQSPVQITFRDMAVSDVIEARCWDEFEKLVACYDRIAERHVTITRHHDPEHRGNRFEVRVHLTMPGQEFTIIRQPPKHLLNESAEIAIEEAFDRARRRLIYTTSSHHGATGHDKPNDIASSPA